MRLITEANAKIITEALEEKVKELQELPQKSLRLQNKIRLIGIAIKDLQNNKIDKNGRAKN